VKLLLLLVALAAACGGVDAPEPSYPPGAMPSASPSEVPGGIVEMAFAVTLPPGGHSWYAEYSTTRVNCGLFSYTVNPPAAAVYITQSSAYPGALLMQRDPVTYDPQTNTTTQIGAMPTPGHLTACSHFCVLVMYPPNNADADSSGMLRGGWALAANAAGIPCGIGGSGPLQVDVLPGGRGLWANWQIHPQTYGWSFSAAGQIYTNGFQPTGCTWSTASNLFMTTGPVPP